MELRLLLRIQLVVLTVLTQSKTISAGFWEDDLDYINRAFPEDTARYCPNLPYYGGFVSMVGQEAARMCLTAGGYTEITDIITDLDDETSEPFYAPIDETMKCPVILLWTPRMSGARRHGQVKHCTRSSCFITENRSWLNHTQTKAIHFYATLTKLYDLPLPRKDHHLWALLHEESPKNNPIFSYEKMMKLYNLTATIKQQSHYPLTTQYLRDIPQLLSTMYVKSFSEKTRWQKENDFASVIFVQSDCMVPSDRDTIVSWMMNHMKIDSYGQCLHNKDLPSHLADPIGGMEHEDFLQLVSKYKFAIAMENGVCADYITEKLWRPLVVGTIPIILGAPNIKEWLPSNKSALVLDDYRSISELVEHINYLSNNEDAYEEFRAYKTDQSVHKTKLADTMERRAWSTDFDALGINDNKKGNYMDHFDCFVCDVIHDQEEKIPRRRGQVALEANKSHYGCPIPQQYTNQNDLTKKTKHSGFWHSAWMSSYCDVTAMLHYSEGGKSTFHHEDMRRMSRHCMTEKLYSNAESNLE